MCSCYSDSISRFKSFSVHTVGDIVELPASRRPIREQTLEELHGGRDDDRSVPILHRQLQLFPRLPIADTIFVEGAVVLNDEVRIVARPIAQGITKDRPVPSSWSASGCQDSMSRLPLCAKYLGDGLLDVIVIAMSPAVLRPRRTSKR